AEGKSSAAPPPRFFVTRQSLVAAFALGAATVLGYAPFGAFPLPVLTLAALFFLWSGAPSPRVAGLQGFGYGLGLFLVGVSWIYVSLHDFGAMPAPLAALSTLLFCAFLALLPAAAGYCSVRARLSPAVASGVLAPAAWTLAEWTRGWIFTGFPWLGIGYSQIPGSPLAGYAPALGIYGVTLATAASAGLIAVLARRAMADSGWRIAQWRGAPLHPASFILVAIWLAGFGLKQVAWTEPVGA